jgi:hypothetical protein
MHERVPIDEILRFLNKHEIRVTYGAVGGAIGVIARSVSARLGHRRPEASWIVSADSGLPTGFGCAEMHPALFRRAAIIRTTDQLISLLRASRGGDTRRA